ncbi:MAG: ATP-binding cassette domain-containing protein [Deltaproteobacteria bacterium]|nr:ATP-binding cassette domain-containing protein [Deltaproteobacteria bacterium]
MSKLIEIKNLCYTAENGIAIFENVDAAFYEGEKVGIIGALGSGKATLTRLLLGLEKPQMGRVYLFDKDIESLKRPELDRMRQEIGVVFENAAVISNLKVIENVMLPLQYHANLASDSIMERAFFLLSRMGYEGDIWTLPGPLPSRTKKIIVLARAMALDPVIMIYDRLLQGFDSYQSLQLLGFIDEFHKSRNDRLSIMLANDERDLKDVRLDRILRIENRRIV